MLYQNINIFVYRNKQKFINLAKYFLSLNKYKIYGRTACLGKDVFGLRYPPGSKVVLFNQQKVRVDLFLDWLSGTARPRAESVKKYMFRQDVYPLIEQQAIAQWNVKNDILFFLMDSFSELSDQKFTHKKEGWSFCCHYTDIDHGSDFHRYFECEGLLPLDKIESVYSLFFDWFEKSFPGKKLFFLHFPTKFDKRSSFIERGAEIFRVMKKYQEERPFIQNLYINDELVNINGNDSFPYHFSKNTNYAFLYKWLELCERCDS